MRLKDADELMRKLESERQYLLSREMLGAEHILVHHAIPLIEEAPTIDAVPVVRCKDCKHCEYASNRIPVEQAWVCYKLGIDVEQDWFCADGERKDNE